MEAAQRMYPYITPHHAKTEGRSWASLTVLALGDPSASRRSPQRLLPSSAEVLWRGAEAAGVADAMTEAEFYTLRARSPI